MFRLTLLCSVGIATLPMGYADIGGRAPKPKPKPKPVPQSVSTTWNYTAGSVMGYTTYPSSAAAEDQFGYAVAISSGGRMLIGAPHVDSGHGAVFVAKAAGSRSVESDPDSEKGSRYELQTAENHVVMFGSAVTISSDGLYAAVAGKHSHLTLPHMRLTPLVSLQKWNTKTRSFEESQVIHLQSDTSHEGGMADTPVSVSVSQSMVVVGAPWVKGHDLPGSTFIFAPTTDANGTRFTIKVYLQLSDFFASASDAVNYTMGGGDAFGNCVAVGGRLLAVGAPEYSGRMGAVAIYSYATGIAEDLITPPLDWMQEHSSNPDMFFGYSVDMQDRGLYVGAPGASDNRGVVFVYTHTTLQSRSYIFAMAVTASDGHTNDMLGYSLSCSDGGLLAAGAPGHAMYGQGSGAVYLFNANTGAVKKKYIQQTDFFVGMSSITPEVETLNYAATDDYLTFAMGSEFGISVAMSDSYLVTGADFALGASSEYSGAVYMDDIRAASSESSINFGYLALFAVALLLPVVAVGALTYKLRKRKLAESNEVDATTSGQANDGGLTLDTSSHSVVSVDMSGHSVAGEATARNAGSFSSLINAPSVFLSSAKARFSELQQDSPMRTPANAPTKNPMTSTIEVAV